MQMSKKAQAIWLVLVLVAVFCVAKIQGTNSLFRDEAVVEGITFSASDNFFSAGPVVISEIMWMGSAEDPEDEWIELKNNTDEEVDLSGWNVHYAGKGKEGHIEIPHGHSIKADGYFLILKKKWDETAVNLEEKPEKDEGMDHVSSMDLKDGGEQLILTDKKGNSSDVAGGEDEWFAGEDEEDGKRSMQRKDPQEDGTEEENWETCDKEECSGAEFWKNPAGAEGLNFGTPGKENVF